MDDYDWTNLTMAAYDGKLAKVKAYLEAGATCIDKGDKDGFTPLILAAQEGHLEVVQALLAAKAMVDQPNKVRPRLLLLLFLLS